MKTKVLVAAHKNYAMPKDPLYLPVFVGKEIHPDVNHTFQGDNTGDNISAKNPYYNELTGIYYPGLDKVKYNRTFLNSKFQELGKPLPVLDLKLIDRRLRHF